ncbi:MAG: hypothetical protein HKN13_09885, partial [Rhodothermales bacterium]|nr:hypothetical protein [Rhodothermales bacterium]
MNPTEVRSQVSGSVVPQVGSDRHTYQGLVWKEPDNLQHAVRELTYFSESGVDAVRVDILRDTLLYAVGDSLGIQF